MITYPSNDQEGYFDFKIDLNGKVSNLTFSPDGKYLAASSKYDRAIYIYEIYFN